MLTIFNTNINICARLNSIFAGKYIYYIFCKIKKFYCFTQFSRKVSLLTSIFLRLSMLNRQFFCCNKILCKPLYVSIIPKQKTYLPGCLRVVGTIRGKYRRIYCTMQPELVQFAGVSSINLIRSSHKKNI